MRLLPAALLVLASACSHASLPADPGPSRAEAPGRRAPPSVARIAQGTWLSGTTEYGRIVIVLVRDGQPVQRLSLEDRAPELPGSPSIAVCGDAVDVIWLDAGSGTTRHLRGRVDPARRTVRWSSPAAATAAPTTPCQLLSRSSGRR